MGGKVRSRLRVRKAKAKALTLAKATVWFLQRAARAAQRMSQRMMATVVTPESEPDGL